MSGKASFTGWAVLMAETVILIGSLRTQAQYGGGSGTAENPYLIGTAAQMNTIGLNPDDWDKHFRLIADIDLEALAGAPFNPIGAFSGVFDGDGHTVANLTLVIVGSADPCDGEYVTGVGLFGSIQGAGAAVRELGLLNPDVRPAPTCPQKLQYVGALAGSLALGTIRNCHVEGGQVSGERYVGGLVGELRGTIWDCWSSSVVSGDDSVGGLVGRCRPGTEISRSHATGRVLGRISVGGLVGFCRQRANIIDCHASGSLYAEREAGGLVGSHEGAISRCWSNGPVCVESDVAGGLVGRNSSAIHSSWAGGYVLGGSQVGGLVGRNWESYLGFHPVVTDSYARGHVQGEGYVGGLIGFDQGGTVRRCYATGKVAAAPDGRTGGLAAGRFAVHASTIEDCFWDTETSGVSTSAGGVGKTTEEMQSLWTYYAAGWDFAGEAFNGADDLWKMCCGRPVYPKLAWEPMIRGDFMDPEGVGPEDLAFLAEYWLQPARMPCGTADLNFDMFVDAQDFTLLAASWRQGARTVIFETTLDVQPDWMMEGQWQFGRPGGGGGTESGHPDPTGGCTGDNVYGVDLRGDYSRAIDGPHYLTAGPFDCRGSRDVRLQFARWLNTDEADYVKTTIELSTDGDSWITLWEYEDTESVLADDAWRLMVYPLGPMADGQEKAYIRWGYEVTDEQAWPMSGWNIDDVALTGVRE